MTKDPYRYFRIEAGELLDQLAKAALDLEKEGDRTALVMHLLRLAHTLKGAARVVKQADIADLAHRIEDALTPHRDSAKAVPREQVDNVLDALDAITAKLALLPQPESGAETFTAAEATARIVRADVAELDMLLEGLGEIGNELSGVRCAVASMERIRDLTSQLSHQDATAPIRLKSIAEEMHALVVAAERNMSTGVDRIDRELRAARDATERLRLVPAASVFNALERTARDAAHSTGKQVAFEASGGEIRIDGEVLDAVQSALIQLVRNAVAHGVENNEQRKKSGKPPIGRVTLEVARRGYRAWFRCRDDGGGVDLEAVRRVLQKKGRTNSETQRLDASALLALLLKGGITTTSVVTELSGRGIGLDVVREAMQRLNGEVLAHTVPGSGTTIELRVPLSLAALEVLMVETDGQVVALPLDAVKRTLRVAPEDISRSPKGDAIVYEGKQIPFMRLELGVSQKKAISQSAPTSGAITAAVIAAADTLVALAVDRLRGLDTVVLRPLPALAPATPIVLGVHLDNEGNPRIVLDPEYLVVQQHPAGADSTLQVLQQEVTRPILIIDDSLTTRMLESSILESAGFTVELAASAEEGLAMAQRNTYALFLVDVEMPGMDGFSFVECTRADPTLRAVPCILVTSRNAQEDRRRGASSGAAAYIVKSEFDQVEFLRRVTDLVRR